MDTTVIRKNKLFFSWQDEKQEAWLEAMSRRGLHLNGIGPLGSFLFVEGSAGEYAYRLDFNNKKVEEEYLQLVRDAGWQNLGRRAGWHYWRKEVLDRRIPELFTDAGSKIRKYQRLMATYVTSAPAMYIIGLAAFKRYPDRYPGWVVVTFISLFMAWILYAAINAIAILMRIKRLEQKDTV